LYSGQRIGKQNQHRDSDKPGGRGGGDGGGGGGGGGGEGGGRNNPGGRGGGAGGGKGGGGGAPPHVRRERSKCLGCGLDDHVTGDCPRKGEEFFNEGGTALRDSVQAKHEFRARKAAAVAAGKPPAYIEKMTKADFIPGGAKGGGGRGGAAKKPWKKQGMLALINNPILRVSATPEYLREGRFHLTTLFSRPVRVLFDSGAVQGNFVSAVLGEWIRSYPARKTSVGNRDLGILKTGKVTAAKGNLGTVERVSKASKVSKLKSTKPLPLLKPKVTFEESEMNLAGTEYSVKLYGDVTANLDFTNEVSDRTDTLHDLKFQVMDTFFDVIIGRPDILRHQLGHRIPRYFGATPLPSNSMSAIVPVL
jgi:hypothetical protein